MERIIKDKLLSFLHANQIISKAQHGFLSGRSTVSQLVLAVNDWSKSFDESKPVDILYLDISKAFDTVSHPKLFCKLEACGINGNLLAWLKAYLSNRKQRVCMGNVVSEFRDCCSGVAQGSVLGPLLFLLYINDLPSVCKYAKCLLFADDAKIYFSVRPGPAFEQFHSDIVRIFEWTNCMQLSVALHKCSVLHVGVTNSRMQYSVDNIVIPSAAVARDLGVLMSSNLRFSEHCAKVVKDASLVSSAIFRSFQNRNLTFLLQMYKTFVRPKLEYATCVWSPSNLVDIKLVESVQRRFTARLPGLQSLDYIPRLIVCNLETLELRRLHFDLIFVYKIVHGMVDIALSALFDLAPIAITRSHSLRLSVPPFRTSTRQSTFACRVVPIWNSLSDSTVHAPTLASFKTRLLRENLVQFITLRG